MIYPEYKYVDTAVGGVHNRNKIMLVTQARLSGVDCYKTYYRYPQAFADHVKKTGSVKGYDGFYFADYIPIDIDNADLKLSHKTAIELIKRLEVNTDCDVSQIAIFFSGAKGFHILLPTQWARIAPSRDLPAVLKKMVGYLLKPYSIDYDEKIYDGVRLFRAAGTINSKTGLYKIPLTYHELTNLSLEEILELAKTNRTVEFNREITENEQFIKMYRQAVNELNQKPKINGVSLEGSDIPKNAKVCYYKLLNGVEEGCRDKAAYLLACHFKKQGFTSDLTTGLLQAWNQKNTPPLNPRDIEIKIQSAYGPNAKDDFGCNDELLRRYCSPNCYLAKNGHKDVADITIISSFDEAVAAYKDYAYNLSTQKVTLNIPVIGKAMRGIAPGETCYILARSGVGKTLTLLNILMRISATNRAPQLFFTMEQPTPQIYERMAQIANNMSGEEIEELYAKKQDTEKIEDLTRKMFGNLYLVDKVNLNCDQMIDIVRMAEQQKIGKKVAVVGIDYLGRMERKGRSVYESVSEHALRIKDMAKELNVAVIVLAQVSREGGDGTTEIEMDMARDSGQIEESADFIIGLWRPHKEENKDKDEDIIRAKLMKNRKGGDIVTYDFKFIKKALRLENSFGDKWWDVRCPWDD